MKAARPLYLTLVLCAVVVVRSPLLESLWLDETMTVWAAQGTLGDTIQRSLETIPHSPLYFVGVKAALALPAPLELAARLPSLLACALASLLLYILSGRGVAGSLAVALFVTNEAVLKASFSARPYALGLASAVVVLFCLERFMRTGSAKSYTFASLAAVFCFYLVYPFGLVFLALAAALIAKRAWAGKAGLAFAASIVLIAPGLVHLAAVFRSRSSVRFVLPPSLLDLITVLVPPPVLVTAAVALVLTPLLTKEPLGRSLRNVTTEGADARFALWWLTPPLLLWIFSRVSDSSIFLDRYFLLYAAGLAAAAARLVSRLPHPAAIAGVCIAVLIGQQAVHRWAIEDWRGAIQEAGRTGEPLLMSSGYFEASRWTRPLSGAQRAYLLSPLGAYPASIPAAPLLSRPSPEEQKEEAQQALSELHAPERLTLICLKQTLVAKDASSTTLCDRAAEALSGLGYGPARTRPFGQVTYQRWSKKS